MSNLALAIEYFFSLSNLSNPPLLNGYNSASRMNHSQPENGFSLLMLPLGVISAIEKQSLHFCFAFENRLKFVASGGFYDKNIDFYGATGVILLVKRFRLTRKFLNFD